VVTFEDHCNLVNVKVPDGVLIHGGNLHHGIDAPTGDPARPVVRLLCECEKCCTALAQLQDDIAAGTLPKNERGMVLHHEMKPRYVERRKDGSKVIDDRARAATGNLDALKKYGQDLSPSLMTTLARGE
jgi:hypothetical protein